MRYVARHDYALALEVAHWPLREMLLAWLERAHEDAAVEYRHESVLYTIRQAQSTKRIPRPVKPRFLRIKK